MKYKHYKKNLNIILEKDEKDHYNKLFESHKSDMRKSWQLISEIINKKQKKKQMNHFPNTDDEVVANNFNQFFVNIGPSLAKKIPNTSIDPLRYIPKKNLEGGGERNIYIRKSVKEPRSIYAKCRRVSIGP